MVLECKVLMNNEAITVIRYGDINVQIPAIGRKAEYVKVKDDGTFTVVDDDYVESELNGESDKTQPLANGKKTKTRKKKTPIIEEVELIEG